MARCLLGIGSNLGDRRDLLRTTCRELSDHPKINLLARSQWHETAPIGGPSGQSPFLNGALIVETTLQPEALAAKLRELETGLGRSRRVRWSARTVDLDVLLIDETTVDTPDLVVPHPRMSFRRFVLEPAVEIAPWMKHPTSGWTLAQLLHHLNTAAQRVAVAAADGRVAGWVAEQVAQSLRKPMGCNPWALALLQSSTGRSGSFWSPDCKQGRPALVLAVDPADGSQLLEAAVSAQSNSSPEFGKMSEAKFSHLLGEPGPLARITATDPATVLAEAQAAILAVWPNLLPTAPCPTPPRRA